MAAGTVPSRTPVPCRGGALISTSTLSFDLVSYHDFAPCSRVWGASVLRLSRAGPITTERRSGSNTK